MAVVSEVWSALKACLLTGVSSLACLSPFTTPKFFPFPSLHERLVQIPNRFVGDWTGMMEWGPWGLGWAREGRRDSPVCGEQITQVCKALKSYKYFSPHC